MLPLFPDHTAEAEIARGGINRFGVAGRRTVALTISGSAQEAPALQNLLRKVPARILQALCRAARVLRIAACFRRIGFMAPRRRSLVVSVTSMPWRCRRNRARVTPAASVAPAPHHLQTLRVGSRFGRVAGRRLVAVVRADDNGSPTAGTACVLLVAVTLRIAVMVIA
jgi:hypothetical protein